MNTTKTKKTVCAVTVVIASVLGTYTTQTSSVRSVPTKLYPQGNPLRFSKEGLELIGNAEGCRQDPYTCPAGRLTAGMGHTGSGVSSNVSTYSMGQIAKWFAEDTMAAQSCVERYVENPMGHALTQGEFDAYGSFILNNGCTKFRGYPVYAQLMRGERSAACQRLTLYNKGGGQTLPGLVDRRNKESKLCLRDLHP